VLRAELGTKLLIGLELQHHWEYGLLPPPTLVSSMHESSTLRLPRVPSPCCPARSRVSCF